ncbi:MAG: N-methyl-L-tryptophan oxidase [Bryobacteraceae bacterium]
MSSTKVFDVAVVGLGTMGSFACMELARRGAAVVGLDRFAPPHGHGSHSGDTRIYREAYAENPNYVPFVKQAGQLWDLYREQAGCTLLHRCGMLSMGPPKSPVMIGIQRSAGMHQVQVQQLSAAEIRREYPAFHPPDDHVGMYDGAAGWIDVNAALNFSLKEAGTAGATILLNQPVQRWQSTGSTIRIESGDETFEASRLILAAGAWSDQLITGLPLSLERKVLVWVDAANRKLFQPGTMPVFMFAEKSFYGFPNIGDRGVKLAIDTKSGDALADPTAMHPVVADDLAPVLELAAKYLPNLGRPAVKDAKTCIYTMTPDENFIIDRHPEHENVYFAAGFSGHGFKFAPAVGLALADLALTGQTTVPIGFLKLRT